MYITIYRHDGKQIRQRTVALEKALHELKTEGRKRLVSRLRENLPYEITGKPTLTAKRIPIFVFGAVCEKGNPGKANRYNGLVLLEVNRLSSTKEARDIREKAANLPQTLLAFIGCSGLSVKIVVPFTLPGGKLPQKAEEIEKFHTEAYRQAVNWYAPQLKREIELKKPSPVRGCRQSFDPDLYYNPAAVAIRMEQPTNFPQEEQDADHKHPKKDPIEKLLPAHHRNAILYLLFQNCLNQAIDDCPEEELKKGMEPFYTRLAEYSLLSGIPVESAVKWTCVHYPFREEEIIIRALYKNVYKMDKKFGSKPCISLATTLMAKLEDFMQRRYQFRYNAIKQITEYQEIGSFYFEFCEIGKRVINSICINALSEGLQTWDADIKRYLESDRVPTFNPIEDYLSNLPPWDGKERIRELAGRVPCRQERWPEFFHTWFLSMVAHWIKPDITHANSTVPLLVGDQGCGKSTFCKNLLPHELRDYYTDSIHLSDKRKAEQVLGRFALINMDEFDSIGETYQSFIKHLLQKTIVQTRLAYSSVTEKMRRYASFIATSNNFDLLTDPTGSRRFICINITGTIDQSQPVDYLQLYAQAREELRQGVRYWFTREDEAYITACNREFQCSFPEEEILLSYFCRPETEGSGEELTCGEMLQIVRQIDPYFRCGKNAAIKLGRSLRSKFEHRRAHRGYVYKVLRVK